MVSCVYHYLWITGSKRLQIDSNGTLLLKACVTQTVKRITQKITLSDHKSCKIYPWFSLQVWKVNNSLIIIKSVGRIETQLKCWEKHVPMPFKLIKKLTPNLKQLPVALHAQTHELAHWQCGNLCPRKPVLL